MGCCDLILHRKCYMGLQFKVLFYYYKCTRWFIILKQDPYLMNYKLCRYALDYNLKMNN
jgi:hypothetical protein